MPLKVLCNENLPAAIVTLLQELGFDAVRVKQGMKDPEIASQAKQEKLIILTFDSDFSNILVYPPKHYFGIIRIKISPPLIDHITRALKSVFNQFKTSVEFQGKLIILEATKLRIWEG
jgi:predicted nuclease of predicted toxin-antitoxin system